MPVAFARAGRATTCRPHVPIPARRPPKGTRMANTFGNPLKNQLQPIERAYGRNESTSRTVVPSHVGSTCEKLIGNRDQSTYAPSLNRKPAHFLSRGLFLASTETPIVAKHVKGHQDDNCTCDDLPFPARINVDCDELAGKFLREPPLGMEPRPSAPIMSQVTLGYPPEMQCYIYCF